MALREQARDHTRQHIAHAATCHAGIAPRAYGDVALRIRDQGAGTFEHRDGVIFVRKLARRGITIAFDCRDIATEQARGLARMRRQHALRRQRERFAREQVKRVGIQHDRLAARDRRGPQRVSPGAQAKSGTDRDDICALEQRLPLVETTLGGAFIGHLSYSAARV